MKKLKHFLLTTLGALALATMFGPSAQAVEPPADKNYMGMNTWYPTTWDGARPFADVMHGASTYVNASPADSIVYFKRGVYTPPTPDVTLRMNGTYTIRFTGQATIAWAYTAPAGVITISGQSWDSVANITTATLTVAWPDDAPLVNWDRPFQLKFTNTKLTAASPVNSGISGLTVSYPPGTVVDNLNLPAADNIGSRTLLDANRWPMSDTMMDILNDNNLTGTYKLIFTGQATVVSRYGGFTVTTPVYDAVNNISTADVIVGSTVTSMGLKFTNTKRTAASPVNSGITNIRLYRPGYPTDGSVLFSGEYKNVVGYTDVIRFMDWNQVNFNPSITWSDRSKPGDGKWDRELTTVAANEGNLPGPGSTGVPYEAMVRLCNEINADLYVCVPVRANDTYITNLARLIRYGSDGVNPYTATQASPVWSPLNANLKVYVEYGNENWNSGLKTYTFPRQVAITQLASPTVFPAEYDGLATNLNTLDTRYKVFRASQVSLTFRAVFGDSAMPGTSANPRVRPLLESQQTGGNQMTIGLPFLEKFYGSTAASTPPNSFNTVVRPVSYFFYGGGGSAYYHLDSVLDNGTSSSDPASVFAAGTGNYAPDWFRRNMYLDALWCGNYGLKRVAYEGGLSWPELNPGPNFYWGDAQKWMLNLDPRVAQVELEFHNAWTESGGGLFVYYMHGNDPTWGFTPDFDNYNAPKLLGLLDIWNATRPTVVTKATAIPGTTVFRNLTTFQLLQVGTFNTTVGGELAIDVSQGDWLAFGVDAPAANTYSTSIRYSKSSTATATVGVWVNGVLQTTQVLPGTASVMTDSASFNVTLASGLNVIRIKNTGTTSGFTLAATTVTLVSVPDVTSGMVARWALNFNTQDTAPEGVSTDNGTAVGSPTYAGSAAAAVGTGAIILNGAGKYVSVPDNIDASFTDDFSLFAWIKPTAYPSSGNNAGLVAKWLGVPSAQRSYALQITPTGQIIFAVSSTGASLPTSTLTTGATVPLGSWSHVAGVYDSAGAGSSLKVYINGTLVSTLSSGVTPTIFNSSSPVTIGHVYNLSANQYSFNGQIDEVRLYNRALSASEVGNVSAQHNVPLP